MAGVHGLQHVEGLGATNLSDQDAVGAHSEAVAQQLPDGELTLAFDVGRAVLERDYVRVIDLQLGRVLDGDHALVVRDEARDHVERGGLARTGAARHQDVHPSKHRGLEELRHGRTQAALARQVVHAEHRVLELADRQRGTVDGRGSDDRVDAAAVGQARIDHRVEAVDVAPGRGHHAPDRLEQLILVVEADLCFGEHAATLDEDLVGAVDHDLAHRPVVEKRVERAVTDRGAKDDVGERRFLARVERDAVLGKEAVKVGAHRARECERVASGKARVAHEREPVAEVVCQLVQVLALACRRLLDVGSTALRSRSFGDRRPCIDELHLEQGARCGDSGDHALPLGQPDLDREADAVVGLARVHVHGYPFPVAEPQDRLASRGLVTRVGLEVRVLDRAENHVLDVRQRDQPRAVRVRLREDREACRAERACLGLAVLEPGIHAVNDDVGPLPNRHETGLRLGFYPFWAVREHRELTHGWSRAGLPPSGQCNEYESNRSFSAMLAPGLPPPTQIRNGFAQRSRDSGGRRRSTIHLEPGIRFATPFTSAAREARAGALLKLPGFDITMPIDRETSGV